MYLRESNIITVAWAVYITLLLLPGNQLLSVDGLKLFILLYIEDFEITNSLMGIKKSAQSMWNVLETSKPTS